VRYPPVICLEAVRKTSKMFSQVSQYTGSDLNPADPKYKFEALSFERACTECWCDGHFLHLTIKYGGWDGSVISMRQVKLNLN
jgi:hypothetical protein